MAIMITTKFTTKKKKGKRDKSVNRQTNKQSTQKKRGIFTTRRQLRVNSNNGPKRKKNREAQKIWHSVKMALQWFFLLTCHHIGENEQVQGTLEELRRRDRG